MRAAADHEKVIKKLVDNIAKRFSPRKIILFGSRARGTPGENSDVDLLVIMDTPRRTLLVAGEIAASVDHPLSLDIIVRTPEAIEKRMDMGDPFIAEILRNGSVLYEASD